MAAQLTAARQALDSGNVEQASSTAAQAFKAMVNSGESQHLGEAVRLLVEAQSSPAQLEDADRDLESLLNRFRAEVDSMAQARTLLAIGELRNACLEPNRALEAVKQARSLPVTLSNPNKLQALTIEVKSHMLNESSSDAQVVARQLLAMAQTSGDKEDQASAWQALAGSQLLAESTAADARESAQTALNIYREVGKKQGEAAAWATVAKAWMQQGIYDKSLQAAEEALAIWRAVGQSKGVVSALEIFTQASALDRAPHTGLRKATAELELMRESGNRLGERDILDMLTHAHAMLREPVSALHYARQALALYREMGDAVGAGWTLHTIAEMQRMEGSMGEATLTAQQALSLFKAAGSRQGSNRASETLNSLYAERGLPEKAPKRSEALRALKEFKQAVQDRNEDDARAAESRLNEVRNLVTDQEIANALQPLVQREETADFLESLGWDLGRSKAAVPSGTGQTIYHYSKNAFYLGTLLSGMNFGPQFRAVHPHRLGSSMDPTECMPMSVAQLPETEGWQMETLFRHGVMDCAFQQLQVLDFPPKHPPKSA